MNRRSFFKFLGAGAATLALSEAIPFGRVWSFPSKIVVPEPVAIDLAYYSDFSVLYLQPAAIALANEIDARILKDLGMRAAAIGTDKPIRIPTTVTLDRRVGIDFEYLLA